MKIAQVVSLYESVPPVSRNGLEFVVSWLTEELVRRGHEVTLFASSDSKTSARLASLFPKSMHEESSKVWQQPTPSFWNGIYAASMADQFDIIHDHSQMVKMLLPFISKPIVETIHAAYDDDFRKNYLTRQPYANQMKFIVEQSAKVNYVTISKRQQEFFKACEPYYFKHYTNIYNGIPVEKFSFNASPKDYLLFIGYICKDKGADTAVQIARKLGMKLILAGDNRTQEPFFDTHIKPYLNDKIQYVGPVNFEQKNELYRNAIAKIAPIRWHEPFGLTLIEPQACGTPVIAFNKGAAAEVIKHGETGFVIETEEEMIEAVGKISQIDRQACRTWVEQNFTVQKMVDGYEKLYESLVRK